MKKITFDLPVDERLHCWITTDNQYYVAVVEDGDEHHLGTFSNKIDMYDYFKNNGLMVD